jgi:hypothetical protein
MVVSYEEAREIVRQQTEPGWDLGTYCLNDRTIIENDEIYVFDVGAREYLVDGDTSYCIFGGVPVVYKANGRFDTLPSPMIAMDPTVRTRHNPSPTLIQEGATPGIDTSGSIGGVGTGRWSLPGHPI